MRVLESGAVGLALALVVVGTVLGALAAPPFTRILVRTLDVARSSGLDEDQAEQVAEQVRLFVVDSRAPRLPEEIEGRPAFDPDAVAHLEDVRDVLLAARRVTGILAAALAAWMAVAVSRKRFRAIVSALLAAAGLCLAIPLIAAVFAISDFGWFFAWFHTLFFASGTWVFPYDSLLIQLFPEAFWMSAAAAWAAGTALGGLVLGGIALALRSATRQTQAPPQHEPA